MADQILVKDVVGYELHNTELEQSLNLLKLLIPEGEIMQVFKQKKDHVYTVIVHTKEGHQIKVYSRSDERGYELIGESELSTTLFKMDPTTGLLLQES